MNYEQKYKEALERAKEFVAKDNVEVAEYIFPELAEFKDEKIRKALLNEFIHLQSKSYKFAGLEGEDILAWLEKQGERKPYGQREECSDCQVNYAGECKGSCSMKKGEQKPFKVEPKFKNGQWIVWQNKCYKVNYNGCGYELVDQNGLSTSLEYGTIDENAHLWDITKDVKDGDVLSDGTTIFIFKDLLSDGSVMSYCDYDTDSGESNAFCPLSVNLICSKITPATKEQRDTLERAMADAGYTFNFEKKELKKIEQRMISAEAKEAGYDKLVWSEEDETTKNNISHIIRQYDKISKKENQPCWYVGDCLLWMQNIKDRVQPKQKQEWSEEDEKILGILIDAFEDYSKSDAEWWKGLKVNELTKWLKSLKNRIQSKQEYNEEAAETAAKKYRDYRQKCGIKELVTLDETEDAYYNGFLDALQTERYKED